MNKSPWATDLTREVRHAYPDSREQLFHAWIEPQLLGQWFHPAAQLTTPAVQADLRVGGAYRITMQNPDQQRFTVTGVYQVVEPPSHLAFTWRWEHAANEPETRVTIELHTGSAHETELVLTHRGFANEQEQSSHRVGWEGTWKQLAGLVINRA